MKNSSLVHFLQFESFEQILLIIRESFLSMDSQYENQSSLFILFKLIFSVFVVSEGSGRVSVPMDQLLGSDQAGVSLGSDLLLSLLNRLQLRSGLSLPDLLESIGVFEVTLSLINQALGVGEGLLGHL